MINERKTKRVLNLDRLRADVKAWVDDPNRKYPEWMVELGTDVVHGDWLSFEKIEEVRYFDWKIIQITASIIGINPDDYFEEVEVTE